MPGGGRQVDPAVRAGGVDGPLHDALAQLQQRGAHMALVVDPAGAVLGVATLEDVIEELVGEIRDAAHEDEPA